MTAHRWAMLETACANNCGLIADDTEVRRGGHSYTVDTLSMLRSDKIRMHFMLDCWRRLVCDLTFLASLARHVGVLQFGSHDLDQGSQLQFSEQIEALCREHEKGCFDISRNGQIVKSTCPC